MNIKFVNSIFDGCFSSISAWKARQRLSLSIGITTLLMATVGTATAQTPSAPTIGQAFAGNAQAFVSFTAPTSAGVGTITAYTATCTPNVGQGAASGSGITAPISVSGLVNNTAYNCTVTATNAAGVSAASATVSVTPLLTAPLTLIGVKSRKTHGVAGIFDVPIDSATLIDGLVNVEPRVIGAGHSIVFQFNATVTSIGPVTAIDESALAVAAATSQNGNEVVVTLTGIADNKRVNVVLPTVNGTTVNSSASVGFLVGDVNDTRAVNSSDISSVKARSGQTTTVANFRADVNATGAINASDISATKSRSGTSLRNAIAPSGGTVARVAIDQTGLMLTQAGDFRQLSAKAFDAQGNVLAAPITWTSGKPSVIVVDATGKATAAASNGASQIVAAVGGIQSAPLLALVTQTAPGAILLTDAQIIGEPFETTPNAPPSFTNTYQVRLSGVSPPAIGAILINTESKIVAGRVVAVDSTGNPIIVTLGLLTAREMFPSLDFNETIDMSNAAVNIPADIAAAYNITRVGNTFSFAPKATAGKSSPLESTALKANANATIGAPQAGATGTSALPPFTSCEVSITGAGGEGAPLPIALSAPPLFTVTVSPVLDVSFNLLSALLVKRFVITAEPAIRFEGGVSITAAFEGKIECKAVLFVYLVPAGGPIALILGGLVPFGVGFEAGGKITVATMGIGTKVDVQGKIKAGVVCPGGNPPCSFEGAMDNFTAKVTPTLDAPSLGDVRVEPSLSAFGYMEASIGNVFLKSLRFDFVKAKAAATLAGSFALKESQLADPLYASDYKLSLDVGAGAGGNLGDVLTLLGLPSVSAIELKRSTDIAKSPAGIATGAVTADKASFVSGDTINFTIKLDPATVDFFPGLGPYNVKKIQLVRKVGGTVAVVASVNAAPAQTTFNLSYTAPDSGTAAQFSAFVVTSLLPLDLLALELGTAVGTADFMVANAAVRLRVPCTPVTTVSSVLPRPLPFALANSGSLITIAQESEFVYGANFTVNLAIGRSCPDGGGDRGSTDANAFLTIIPKVTGTLRIESDDEPLDRVPPRIATMSVVAGTQLPLQRIFVIVDGSFSNAIQLRDTRIATLTFVPEVTVASASVQMRPACATATSTFSPEKQTVPFTLANDASVLTVAQQSEFVYTVNFSANLPIGKTCVGGASDGGSTDAAAFLTIIPRVSGTLTVERVMDPAGMNPSTIVSTIPVVAGTSVSLAPVSALVNGSLDSIVQLSGARIATLTFTATP